MTTPESESYFFSPGRGEEITAKAFKEERVISFNSLERTPTP